MGQSTISKLSKQKPTEETFDFPSLPWVCQKRFAEICDARTLKTFASINAATRSLSKGCHSIENVFIEDGIPSSYILSCYCKSSRCCKIIDATSLPQNQKFDVLGVVRIHEKSKESGAEYFQKLPINLKSNEKMCLNIYQIKFSVLKSLITPNLKSFEFSGRIQFDLTVKGFIEFVELLSKLEHFQ